LLVTGAATGSVKGVNGSIFIAIVSMGGGGGGIGIGIDMGIGIGMSGWRGIILCCGIGIDICECGAAVMAIGRNIDMGGIFGICGICAIGTYEAAG